VIVIAFVAMANLCAFCSIASATISGAVSYGASWLTLNQYAQSTNAYIEHTERTCEKRPETRRGKSHKKPKVAKWTPTNAR
jgi:hypothetical protein